MPLRILNTLNDQSILGGPEDAHKTSLLHAYSRKEGAISPTSVSGASPIRLATMDARSATLHYLSAMAGVLRRWLALSQRAGNSIRGGLALS